MRFRSLKNWPDPEKVEGLLFFAQLVEELLFDYTMDTYKPSAMNSSTLCVEVINTLDEIERNRLDETNLTPVIEELLYSLRKDIVAKELVRLSIDQIEKKLFDDNVSRNEKRVYIELIYHSISLEKYKFVNERLLKDAVGNNSEKKRIRALARSYITTLISIGYHYSYIYASARQYFFIQNKKVSDSEFIEGFFAHFPFGKQKYVAVIKADKIFKEIQSSCGDIGIEIHEVVPSEFQEKIKEKNFELEDGYVYVVIKEFSAHDVNTARLRSQRILELVSSLAALFHHKTVPSWQRRALLVNTETGKARLVSPPLNPMLKCEDLRAKDAARKLNAFMHDFSMTEEKSFERFHRSAELHSLALRFDAPENQLLNIWMALETIVPSEAMRKRAKINNVIDHVVPFLTLAYIPSLIERLSKDIFIWDKKIFADLMKSIDGASEVEKIARLLVMERYKRKRGKLYKDCNNFYLLKNRIAYLNEVIGSKKKVRALLRGHEQRLEWQIRRIYRARNSVVHAGELPFVIEALIENVHTYWDTVTNQIIRLVSRSDDVNSLDQAFKHTEVSYNTLWALLKGDEDIEEEKLVKEVLVLEW